MILYSHGDSVVWGAELEDKQKERFSYHLSKELGAIDCNNASAGVSNDYIYRQTMRDVTHFLEKGKCWSEENGWVTSDEMTVVIGWTSPTRFEWWNGKEYQQERLWVGYDKWGDRDKDRTTEDEFVLNQTEVIPSYIRTFNHILGLGSWLDLNEIPYYFFNVFYEYDLSIYSNYKIDKFGRDDEQLGLQYLYDNLPLSLKTNMYNWLKENNTGFHERNHPTKESHKLWSNYLTKIINGSYI